MARDRRKVSAAAFNEALPEQRPAMADVDALALYQEMVRHKMDVPGEVRTAAIAQANEGTPEGHVTVVEEYLGRLRVQTIRKG